MPSVITDVGRQTIADALAAQPPEGVTITTAKFGGPVFQDPANPPAPSPSLTSLEGAVLHSAPVTRVTKIDPNNVAYSVYLDTGVGDFTITQVGYFADDGAGGLVLVMVSNLPPVYKRRNIPGQTGNAYKHTEILSILDAAQATQITLPPETWQFDWAEQLATKQALAEKAQPNGYASLDAVGDVPDGQIPPGIQRTSEKGAASGYAGLDAAAKLAQNVDAARITSGTLPVVRGGTGAASLGASKALQSNAGGNAEASAVTTTELATLSGVTGAIQTQLDAKEGAANKGAANGYAGLDVTGKLAQNLDAGKVTTGTLPVARGGTGAASLGTSKALQSNVGGNAEPSAVTTTELATLSGITGAIQTQLNAKEATANKGVANGYAGLDAAGDVPDAQVPPGVQRTSEKGVASGYAGLDATAKLAQNVDAAKITSGTLPVARGGTGAASLGASKALQSNPGGAAEPSAVTTTELAALSGVTGAIQTQLNAKEVLASKGVANGYVGLDASARVVAPAAQGTAPLSVTSTTVVPNLNADMVDGIDSARILYGINGAGSGRITDFSAVAKSGFYDASDAANAPGPGWYYLIHVEHGNQNGYSHQIAIDFGGSQLFIRVQQGAGAWGAWQKLWTANNDGAGSGLDADLVDGEQASAFEHVANKGIANGYAELDATGKLAQSLDAEKITTGVLPVGRGGTGNSLASPNRAVKTDASGNYAAAVVTATELDYLSGVTGAIQTQLNAREALANKGVANGYASLDADGLVPLAQIPLIPYTKLAGGDGSAFFSGVVVGGMRDVAFNRRSIVDQFHGSLNANGTRIYGSQIGTNDVYLSYGGYTGAGWVAPWVKLINAHSSTQDIGVSWRYLT